MKEISIDEKDKILVVAPHPDDECIGVGGLLAAYAQSADVWVMTDGRYGSHEPFDIELANIRKAEFISEMEYVGVNDFRLYGIEDGTLKYNLDALNYESLSRYSMIFVPHSDEIHPDHKATYKIVCNAIEHQERFQGAMFQYEITTPMRGATHYLNITSNMGKKLKCISMHESQKQLLDYCEIAKSLNSFRANIAGVRNSFLEIYKYTNLEGKKNEVE